MPQGSADYQFDFPKLTGKQHAGRNTRKGTAGVGPVRGLGPAYRAEPGPLAASVSRIKDLLELDGGGIRRHVVGVDLPPQRPLVQKRSVVRRIRKREEPVATVRRVVREPDVTIATRHALTHEGLVVSTAHLEREAELACRTGYNRWRDDGS